MKVLRLDRNALSVGAAAALLAACGSQPPIGATSPMRQTVEKSWMLPNAAGRDLLYITKKYLPNGGIYVYTYPGLKLMGELDYGVGAAGECVDTSGDVFIVEDPDGSSPAVYEYKHGGDSLFAQIDLPTGGQGCSVDPTSERLAVTSGSGSQLLTFNHTPKRGWLLPRRYSVPGMTSAAYCAFDSNGDLFVDGAGNTESFELAELPKGSHQFTTITLNQAIGAPGQVQWHEGYLSIGDTGSHVYEFTISGSSATEVASTTLHGTDNIQQFWIQDQTLIGPKF